MILVVLALIYGALAWSLVRRGMRREAAAFLIAPLAPGIVAAVQSADVAALLFFVPFTFVFALPAIPFFFLYRKLGWTNVWSIVGISIALGGLATIPMNALTFSNGLVVTNSHNLLVMVALGALVGFVFWLVAYSPLLKKPEMQ